MKKLLLVLTFFCFFISSVVSAAEYSAVSKEESSAWIKNKAAEIFEALSNRDEGEYGELDNLLLSSIDIPYIAKFVIGKYWKVMTEDQQKRYLDLFSSYILGIYKTFSLPKNTDGIDFEIAGMMLKKRHTEVYVPIKVEGLTTSSENPDGTITVLFSLHKSIDGIKMIDLNVAGISLLMTYRNKIYNLIQEDEEEIEWFLEDFETWVPSLKQDNEDM